VRFPQCVDELVGMTTLNTFGKREGREGEEYSVMWALTVAPLVE
jgi:hypothetical protein